MAKVLFPIFITLLISGIAFAQTGCLVLNFDTYNKVFNNHETATQFYTGNGNNFVWWEGVCGPHTYIATPGPSLGICTLNGSSKTGQIYAISGTFTAPCGIPLDDYVIFLVFGASFWRVDTAQKMVLLSRDEHIKLLLIYFRCWQI